MNPKDSTLRDPGTTQAWLVGSGIASLAAAVHLIKDAQMPGSNIHILDRHPKSGGGITSSGDSENGFLVRPGSSPYFHAECVENLLSLVPIVKNSDNLCWIQYEISNMVKAPYLVGLQTHDSFEPKKDIVNDRMEIIYRLCHIIGYNY